MVKKCLKSWIFWLLMSIMILGVGFLYGEEIYDYYDESFELTYLCLFMISNTICLVNFSRKNGVRKLLTILISSFAVSLFGNVGYQEDFFDYDLLYSISALLFFFVCIPAGTLILLKLVWRDKSENETENKDDNKDEKLVKKIRTKVKKK